MKTIASAMTAAAILDDYETDWLTGNQQQDWFWAFNGDTTDEKNDEASN